MNYFGFIENFLHLKLFFFALLIFDFFYKPNIRNNLSDISSFEKELNKLSGSAGFYLKSKTIEGSHKGKGMFFNFGHFFSKCTFLQLCHFFSSLVIVQ